MRTWNNFTWNAFLKRCLGEKSGFVKRMKTTVETLPRFCPSELFRPRQASSSKLSSGRRKSAGHQTQSAAHSLGDELRCEKPSSITVVRSLHGRHRVLGATPGVFTAQINQTHLLSVGTWRCLVSVKVISSRRMKIDHLLSALRLYERRTPADPPPATNPGAPPSWRTVNVAYRRTEAEPTPIQPPLPIPSSFLHGPETGRKECDLKKKKWKCFSELSEGVLKLCSSRKNQLEPILQKFNILTFVRSLKKESRIKLNLRTFASFIFYA